MRLRRLPRNAAFREKHDDETPVAAAPPTDNIRSIRPVDQDAPPRIVVGKACELVVKKGAGSQAEVETDGCKEVGMASTDRDVLFSGSLADQALLRYS